MSKKVCRTPKEIRPGITIDCGRKFYAKRRCKSCYETWRNSLRDCEIEGCNSKAARNTKGKRAYEIAVCREHARLEILFKRGKGGEDKRGAFKGGYAWLTQEEEEAQLKEFRSNIEPVGQCWIWQGDCALNPAYGLYRRFLAHRWSYTYFVGGHGHGQELDHACSNALCVRPDHLVPITKTANINLRETRAGLRGDDLLSCTDLIPLPANVLLWAMQNGLPCGKGARYDEETAQALATGIASVRARAQEKAARQAQRAKRR